MGSVADLATEERRSLLELVEGFTAEQWLAPTLCAGWSVRDVVLHHISYDLLTGRETLQRMVSGRANPGTSSNDARLAELSGMTTTDVVAALREHVRPTGLTSGFGSRISLLDGMIHQQDIRRPLGLPRTIPGDRIRPALNFALWAPPVRGAVRGRGVRLVADDLDWSFGRGPEVRGTAEALLLAMGGRTVVLDELSGPGRDRLARNLGALP
ncbi:maleylpyruvate isomerase family mycothiol-dependent enzyme [Tsukamurella ocularis]|uniref:maleylpyruvate isomerase family mycothiol-dependent enzyme n=1 Tax=Tsukamurella ocularis TaxID=1970234 RepID=UPI0039EE6398